MKYRTKRKILNTTSVITVILAAVFSLFSMINIIFNFVYITTNVHGYSMLPTLNANLPANKPDMDGDSIYINKIADVEVDNIVVAKINWPIIGEDYIIKRLVGKPGDSVKIVEKDNLYYLYNNDNLIYTKEVNSHTSISYINYINYVVANNFLNNENNDCIVLGENEYFLIGDNWGGSTDSLVNGPVSRECIEGRVDLIIPYGEHKLFHMLKFVFTEILF